jgi:pimeloyl-ACP methyl ester carboxylesterase
MENIIGASRAPIPPELAGMKVGASTLVIWGERDVALTVKNLDGLEKYVPELTVKRMPDASHWVVHERPEEVNRMIREFLDLKNEADWA